jgi:hypothetical protein
MKFKTSSEKPYSFVQLRTASGSSPTVDNLSYREFKSAAALKSAQAEASFEGSLLLLVITRMDQLVADLPERIQLEGFGPSIICEKHEYAGWSIEALSGAMPRARPGKEKAYYQTLLRQVCAAFGFGSDIVCKLLEPKFSLLASGTADEVTDVTIAMPWMASAALLVNYRRFALAFGLPDIPNLPLQGFVNDLAAQYQRQHGVSGGIPLKLMDALVDLGFDEDAVDCNFRDLQREHLGFGSPSEHALEASDEILVRAFCRLGTYRLWADDALGLAVKSSSAAIIRMISALYQNERYDDWSEDGIYFRIIGRYLCDPELDLNEMGQLFLHINSVCRQNSRGENCLEYFDRLLLEAGENILPQKAAEAALVRGFLGHF